MGKRSFKLTAIRPLRAIASDVGKLQQH